MPRNTEIKFRRGTASEWSTANPVLAVGEPGLDTTNSIFKIGDGSTAWNSLAAVNNSDHPNISAAGSVNNAGNQFVQDITVDSNGHITEMISATIMVDDTTIEIDSNQLAIKDGAITSAKIGAGGFVFNEAGADVDFRIEGDTEQNLLYVDASEDRVGIGTDSPDGIVHVKGESSNGSHIMIEDTSSSLKTSFYNGNTASVISVDEGDVISSSSLIIKVDGDDKGTFGASSTTFDQNVTINASTNQAIVGNSITVFNEGGANIDFRVEGDTDANLFFLDASKDSVLIGNGSDGGIGSKLHVYEANKTNSTYSRTVNILGRGYSNTDGSYYHIANNSRAEKYLSASTTDGGYCIGVNAAPIIYSPDGTNVLAEVTAFRANPSINSAASNVTVTNAYDIKTVPYFQGTNNTVTNHYGLYLGDAGAGGTTPTNEYGVYQVNTAATNYFGGTLDVRGAAVFNEGGAAVDFRVEGDTDQNLFFVDASTDRVGIGTNAPEYLLDVDGAIGADSITLGESNKYLTMGRVAGGTFGVARIHEILGSFEVMVGANTAAVEITNHSVGSPVVTINPAGIDMDFIVEGDSDANLIYADASTDRVGIGTNSPSKLLDVDGVAKAKSFVSDYSVVSDASTVTFDLDSSNHFEVVLGGNRTLALSNSGTAGQKFTVKLKQDGTGSRTVTWFSTINWPGGLVPTLSTAANKADTFGFICTASNTYDGFVLAYEQ